MIVYNGSTIKAHNDVSLIIITADGLNRTIIWNGKSVEVKMKPREKPWRGQLGLLSDEIIQTSDKNLVIVNMQESKLFFADINSFIDWKNKYFDSKKGVYRDDGLYVKWFSSENNQGKQALDISIWQIMIDNNKPSKLPGSKNLNLTYEDRL